MGTQIPKQYLELKGKPVIVHTLGVFLKFDPSIQIVLVLADGHEQIWKRITRSYGYLSEIRVALGGRTRYDSVKSGLQLIEDGLIIGIHDAVRPLVSIDTLKRSYDKAEQTGSAIPVTEVEETIRRIGKKGSSEHLDRSTLRRVQTPQVFRSEMIRKAYNQPYQPSFTDDASVYESFHGEISLVEGNHYNIKITTPTDLQLASILIRLAE